MYRTAFILALLALAVPARAFPQAAAFDSAARADVSERVEGKRRIRVRTEHGWVELERPAVDSLGIGYRAPGGAVSGHLAWGEISVIQDRKSAAPTGAAVGAVTLGVVGLVVGLAATGECSGGFMTIELCGASSGDVATLTFGGALVGGAIGLLLTAPFMKWSTIYEAEAPPPVRPVVMVDPVARRVTAAVVMPLP